MTTAWLLVLSAALPASGQERLAVIVSSSRDVELSIEEVSQIYLKQRRFWSRQEKIVPINREAGSEVREHFTKRVFADEASHLDTYWNRQYYRGVLPPLTLASDEAVRRFVALEPNAIGYILESWLDGSVRAVLFIDSPDPAPR